MSEKPSTALDWGKLGPLRLRARHIAEGLYAGSHRSARRGAGVEFGGHRPYLPGDDLRWLDRHALMRHGRLLVREFETETDRTLGLLLDATPSMGYASSPSLPPKLEFAALLAGALGRVALKGGDPVFLEWLGGARTQALGPVSGRDAFDRLMAALEEAAPGGSAGPDTESVERTCARVAGRGRRGSLLVVFSDLLDLPDNALEQITALSGERRVVVTVRVLDPAEADFPFDGPIRLRALEGSALVETDAGAARRGYLANLERIAEAWRSRLLQRGGQLIDLRSTDDPFASVLRILEALRGFVP